MVFKVFKRKNQEHLRPHENLCLGERGFIGTDDAPPCQFPHLKSVALFSLSYPVGAGTGQQL